MRKCRHCKEEIPRIKDCKDPFQKGGFCNVDHMAKYGLEKGRDAADKKGRKEHKARKEKLKTRGDHAKDAQTEFNKFIRFRDHNLPCISCGRHHSGQYHAGHYRTVGGNPELRFEEFNCHKQCSVCNNHKSGNIVEYRINLAKRISGHTLTWLEGPHKAKKYTIEQLKAIRAEYRIKANQLKKEIDLL
jgi:hypothetical protein